MTNLAKLALAVALTVGICSGGAMAQSTPSSDPAKADTSDPGSTPKTKPAPAKAKKSAHTHTKKQQHKEM